MTNPDTMLSMNSPDASRPAQLRDGGADAGPTMSSMSPAPSDAMASMPVSAADAAAATCIEGQMQRCVIAASGSNSAGCGPGTQACQSGSYGPCVPDRASGPETCNGLDDDCNGKVDDGFDLMTDAMHCGSCSHACAAGESCCGGRCVNTSVDNGNCGGCGPSYACASGMMCCNGACAMPNGAGMCRNTTCGKCAANELCCGGVCTNVQTDVNHCGSCTNACSAGAKAACCNGQCADLTSDQTCGRCDRACGLLMLGGIACKCATTDAGPDCVGLDLANVLQVCL